MKPRLRFGLRAKFLILIFSIASVLFLIIGFYNIRANVNTLRAALFSQVTSFADLTIGTVGSNYNTYRDSGRIKIDEQVSKLLELNPTITHIAVIDLDGKIVYKYKDDSEIKITSFPHTNQEKSLVYGAGGELHQIIYPYKEDSGIFSYSILYEVSNDQLNKSISEIIRTTVLFSVVGMIIMAILVYFLVNQIFLRPVAKVASMATIISAGKLDQEIKLTRNDELTDLANSVNKMADSLKADIIRLKETDKLKSEFMMLVSHNLRTPIAIISGAIELMRAQELTGDTEKMVKMVEDGSKRLATFAEEILTVSTIEAGQMDQLNSQEIDLKQLLDGIAKDFEPSVIAKKLKFMYSSENNLKVHVSPTHFRGAIWNLLDNALKFTTSGTISMVARHNVDRVEIIVADTGIGISAEEVPKLFSKFHRGTDTLKYNFEGHGIGLYITQQILELFGGTISVASQPNRGSTFIVSLPGTVAAPQQPAAKPPVS